jgi:hypothetical protein
MLCEVMCKIDLQRKSFIHGIILGTTSPAFAVNRL